ncbi:Major Facilitator Superfamily protein [Candida albicans]|uniref:Major Facilitator Superfamily protein n=1 Tax=Candida albicans TaxID=5476 RepID=A0A8H6C3A8_CANAX|nr:Major Facilitator Superfamily protein [Candida albicans]
MSQDNDNQDLESITIKPPTSQETTTSKYEGEILTIDSTNWRNSRLLKLQILVSFAVFILFGLAEQTVGTIIPKLQHDYAINDIQISFIFFCSVSGYLLTAMINSITHEYLGIRGVTVLGSTSMALSYLIVSHKPPFVIFLMCYFMSGVGFGTLDASINTWMGNLVDSNQLLGIVHGCYGIGSLISPSLISYLLSKSNHPWKWQNYYVILSVVAGFCLVSLILTFKYETPKKYKYISELRHQQQKEQGQTQKDATVEDNQEDGEEEEDDDDHHSTSVRKTLSSTLVWSFALILFIYVGGEAAFAAWLVTFLLRIKNLDYKTASYMATTFWSGVTIGRIGLGFVTAHFFSSELWANLIYILTSTLLVIVLFLVVLVTGVAIGPIFPTTIVSSVNILPAKYQTSGIGFICAFGGGGGAGIPFLIGLLAESSEVGLRTYPLIISLMFGILLGVWILVMQKYSSKYKRNTL